MRVNVGSFRTQTGWLVGGHAWLVGDGGGSVFSSTRNVTGPPSTKQFSATRFLINGVYIYVVRTRWRRVLPYL